MDNFDLDNKIRNFLARILPINPFGPRCEFGKWLVVTMKCNIHIFHSNPLARRVAAFACLFANAN